MLFGFKMGWKRVDFLLEYFPFDYECVLNFPTRNEDGVSFDFTRKKKRRVTSMTTALLLIDNEIEDMTECFCSHTDVDTKENGLKEALTRLLEKTGCVKEIRSLVWKMFHEGMREEIDMFRRVHESGEYGMPILDAPTYSVIDEV